MKRKYLFNIKPAWDIAALTGLAVLVFLTGAIFNDILINAKSAAASEKLQLMNSASAPVRNLTKQNSELEGQLEVANAQPKPEILTPQEAKEMIALTFPIQLRERFAQITMHCENGALATNAVNTNTNGTKDVGMAQINDYWHKKRVERMFGLDFDIAMKIPILNYIYASFLVEHSGNFKLWACDSKV